MSDSLSEVNSMLIQVDIFRSMICSPVLSTWSPPRWTCAAAINAGQHVRHWFGDSLRKTRGSGCLTQNSSITGRSKRLEFCHLLQLAYVEIRK